jgi:Fic family protein
MFTYHISPSIARDIERLAELRQQIDRQGPLARIWVGRTRRDLEAEASAASVRLEGVSVTADEARRILAGDRPHEVAEKDAAELIGYRDAMALVLSRADDAGFIWQRELVLAIHRSVLSASFALEAGRIRRTQNWLTSTSTGAAVFQPPPAEQVADLLDQLCAWLETTTEPAPVASALAHARLAAIHPFRDGNGRTARIVASLAMFRGGYRVPQFTSLEEWWGRHPADYYAAFACLGEQFDPAADVTPFLAAHVSAQLLQAEALSLRNATEHALWTVLEDIAVHDLHLNARVTHALYDALFGRTLTNRYYREVADVSDVTAMQDLKRLVAASLLEPRGGGRTSRYLGTNRLLETVATAAGVGTGISYGGTDFCEAGNALIAALASRLQGGQIREDSVPCCVRPAPQAG